MTIHMPVPVVGNAVQPDQWSWIPLLEPDDGFSDSGFPVKRLVGLKCATATSIAETPRRAVADAVKELDGDDVDAIVQVGTNLSTVDMFPVLEQYLGKPVIPINIATAWHALRESGVKDKLEGFGRLFSEF